MLHPQTRMVDKQGVVIVTLLRWVVFGGLLAAAATSSSFGANVRGQLTCEGGRAPAVGIAVTFYNPQLGRTRPVFTGGDGMYYINVPAGQYNLEIWVYKQGTSPTQIYPIQIRDPQTDIPRVLVPVCTPQ